MLVGMGLQLKESYQLQSVSHDKILFIQALPVLYASLASTCHSNSRVKVMVSLCNWLGKYIAESRYLAALSCVLSQNQIAWLGATLRKSFRDAS